MKNCFLVYYTSKPEQADYSAGVRALENSHKFWKHKAHLLVREVEGRSQAKYDRWKEAAYGLERYDNVCVLDADMFFCNNVDKYFALADAGFIVGVHNTSNHGEYRLKDGSVCLNQITNCPLFIKCGHPLLKDIVAQIEKAGGGSDFNATNLCLCKAEYQEKLITLSAYLWTNIHHSMLKKYINANWKFDQLMSASNEVINMVHGKFWQESYNDKLIETMQRNHPEDIKHAIKSKKLLVREFERYLNMGQKYEIVKK